MTLTSANHGTFLISAYAIYNLYPIRRSIAEDDDDPFFIMGDEFAQPVEPPEDVDMIEVIGNLTLFIFSNNQGKPLGAWEVKMVVILFMYLKSLPDGYAVVVPITISNREILLREEVLKRAM
ncbi:hypothetical protein K469DRAFT_712933 [Zopfia rhizophila CBS 207.26]|uniref:Uncharacterized protein n=1 Tax=Zopfia rhizophila CBS 207.26 TaxID=1314779 RepID=A0A6A6D7Y4_9PEZI|nr:hypothetical protein K469DRAFT_716251 [Zopfia rhizophila CBS 207.26]KAF2182297.1 hypothetical protein K469DRAFT_712933 [Zopfia rhizophila CBS 207.26]